MVATLIGLVLVLLALHDSFETLVLPRRVTRRWRLTRMYFRGAWTLWRRLSLGLPAGRYRENVLSTFGPLALLGLFVCWVAILIAGFAFIHWGCGTLADKGGNDWLQCAYHSGETFFTLGYGDVTPASYAGKLLAVMEAGMGFGFMAIIIGYLPVLYQAFSRRERNISLLDARAGSPPTASELWRRVGVSSCTSELEWFLIEWEIWAAELLESHLSFPVLSYYRSQHDNQSWLAALAVVLDATALLLVHGSESCRQRARLTFAMARHACVDLCLVFWLPPRVPPLARLTDSELESLFAGGSERASLSAEQTARLRELQAVYEPFLQVLADHFCFRLPRFFPDRAAADNWQTSPWTGRAPGIVDLSADNNVSDRHFG